MDRAASGAAGGVERASARDGPGIGARAARGWDLTPSLKVLAEEPVNERCRWLSGRDARSGAGVGAGDPHPAPPCVPPPALPGRGSAALLLPPWVGLGSVGCRYPSPHDANAAGTFIGGGRRGTGGGGAAPLAAPSPRARGGVRPPPRPLSHSGPRSPGSPRPPTDPQRYGGPRGAAHHAKAGGCPTVGCRLGRGAGAGAAGAAARTGGGTEGPEAGKTRRGSGKARERTASQGASPVRLGRLRSLGREMLLQPPRTPQLAPAALPPSQPVPPPAPQSPWDASDSSESTSWSTPAGKRRCRGWGVRHPHPPC